VEQGRLERASNVELVAVDPTSQEAGSCLAQYFAELDRRFHGGFDPTKDGPPHLEEFAPPDGCLLVVRRSGEPVGCGALRTYQPGVGELKRMWVSPQARGQGIARMLLDRLEHEASIRRMHTLRLDTNGVLTEALRLYRSAGYREIDRFNDNPYAHHWFEKSL
jgi:ribosomal protein S18 acetylase RimI-like enzyme